MREFPHERSDYDDPRKLRELLGKARTLAGEHALTSVVVGLAGFEGDALFPEVVDFVESELRVDDSVFRMTRERVVVLLADVAQQQAGEIIERLLADFNARFPTANDAPVAVGYFEVTPAIRDVSAKAVLPHLFSAAPKAH